MAKEWIKENENENAKQMLSRVLKERPLLLLPQPLNRVPLTANNVVEIVGPTPSAKTEILLQTIVTCILPKNQNGIQFGGLEHSVLFLDLDCRFDIFRLSQLLKLKITEITKSCKTKTTNDDDVALYTDCMQRFSYTRCYDSFEFLAALKMLHHKLEKEKIKNNNDNRFRVVMIDNIGAFYWMDRGFSCLPQGTRDGKKNISFQSVFETVVIEMKRLMSLYPVLVLATKTVSLQVKSFYNSKRGLNDKYREYMPLMWQSFVTHRVLVRGLDDKMKGQDRVCFSGEWLLPALNVSDEFVVCDSGIST